MVEGMVFLEGHARAVDLHDVLTGCENNSNGGEGYSNTAAYGTSREGLYDAIHFVCGFVS